MKTKTLIIFSFSLLMVLTNCGGSDTNSAELEKERIKLKEAEEALAKAKSEKQKADSIASNTLKLETSSENSVSNYELIKLFNISRSSLGAEFVNESDPSRKPEFEIVGKQYYSIGNESYMLAGMGITNPNDFHMSAGWMNIGLFKYEGDRWNRIDLVRNVDIPGGFGGFGEFEKFYLFGSKNVCISVSGGYMAQGNMVEQRCIVGVVDNKLKVIYSGEKSYNDEGALGNQDKETRISFKKTDSEFYELKEEKYSRKRLTKTNVKIFNEKTYKYV
jgi:hypothetical protein